MAYLLNYTREPINSVLYDPRLAYSMHLAISEDGKSFQALNHNSGILFAKATENEDGSLNPKCIKNPFLFQMEDGTFGVMAIRTDGEGGEDEESEGKVLLFTSTDLLEYEEVGLVEPSGEYKEFLEKGSIVKAAAVANIQGVIPHNIIQISEAVADRLKKKLITPVNVGIDFPDKVEVKNAEELGSLRATARYSDGTFAMKKIDWDLTGVDFTKPGEYQIAGKVHQDHYEFPIAYDRADPCVGEWNGKYYFIATNDADGNHSLYIREANSIPELVTAKEHLILDSTTHEGIGGLLWAPEFHIVNGKLYIFHAATPGEFFWEESYVMELREGGNPIYKEDWSAPKRVVRMDGSDICEAGKEITLDMTCFEWEGCYYVIWSQRQFLPKDLGAWLYIAKLNPDKPWQLASEPVILSKPDYGWANNHTFVDEGPFALMAEDKLYITFSSAAVDTSYVVGLLSIAKGKDLLDVKSWKKKNYPILTSRSVEGEYGTGHNAYVIDKDGVVWNTYHARPGTEAPRSSGIRRVHFDIDGEPVLDMTEELDVAEEFRNVGTTLIVK